MSDKSDIIIISANVSPNNLAVEISPSRRTDSPLGDYLNFVGSPDKKNTEAVLDFIKQYEGMIPYFTGRIAYNTIKGFQPSGNSGGSNFNVPYGSISIAAVGENYSALVDGIEALAGEDRGILTDKAKEALGEQAITPYPTPREPLGNLSPTWSYRFSWKDDDAHPGFPNSLPKDIVLGIYENIK